MALLEDSDQNIIDRLKKDIEAYYNSFPPRLKLKPISACACGSDAVKSPMHSDWCPKHEKAVSK